VLSIQLQTTLASEKVLEASVEQTAAILKSHKEPLLGILSAHADPNIFIAHLPGKGVINLWKVSRQHSSYGPIMTICIHTPYI